MLNDWTLQFEGLTQLLSQVLLPQNQQNTHLRKRLHNSLLQVLPEYKSFFEQCEPPADISGQVSIHGKKQQANKAFCTDVLLLTKLLRISAPRAATLYNDCLQEASDPVADSIQVYFNERERALDTLEIIMSKFAIEDALLGPFMQTVLENGFLSDCIRYSPIKVSETSPYTPLVQAYVERERRLVQYCLVNICFYRRPTQEEFLHLCGALKDAPSRYLMASFLLSLDKASQGQRLYLSFDHCEKVQSLLSQTWSNESARGLAILGWIYFLDYVPTCPALADQQVRVQSANLNDVWKHDWCEKFNIFDYTRTEILDFKQEKPLVPFDDIEQDLTTYLQHSIHTVFSFAVIAMKRNFRQMLTVDQDRVAAFESLETPIKEITTWESFLNCLCHLYKNRQDAAIDWWNSDLFTFLKLASDVWVPRFIILFLELLTCISYGPQSASRAHEVLSASVLGHIHWSTFFRTLNSYIDKLSVDVIIELKPQESSLIFAFLKLLGNVAQFSPTARRTLVESQHFRALNTLFELLVRRVQLDLKAALLNTITSFCYPSDSFDMIAHVWSLLEQSQITQGILFDIKQIEAPQQYYPETLAFLKCIKMCLSHPTPPKYFMEFVADHVFLHLDEWSFENVAHKQEIMAVCLDIFHLSVAQLDLQQPVKVIAASPGFDVMCRILSGSHFTSRICSALELSNDCAKATLFLIQNTLILQRVFLEVTAPAMVENAIPVPLSMTGLDQLLAFHQKAIIQIAVLIGSENSLVSLLATKNLSILSQSPVFTFENQVNRLLALLSTSSQAENIIQGAVYRLSLDEQVMEEEVSVSLANLVDTQFSEFKTDDQPGLVHAVRIALVDLLIYNTTQPPWNVAHLLLGFQKEELVLEKPGCLKVILDILKNDPPPHLAEKCFSLIYHLAAHKKTCSVLRYLRSNDFFLSSFHTPMNKTLIPHLHRQAWLLKLLALECHMTFVTGQRSHALKLVSELISVKQFDEENVFEQPLSKLLDIFYNMDLTEPEAPTITYALDEYIVKDARGTLQYNIRAIHSALVDKMGLEQVKQICRDCFELNHAQQLAHARAHLVQGWCQLICIMVAECHELLPLPTRHSKTLEILTCCLDRMTNTTVDIGQWLSQVVLSLITRLKQDSKYADTFGETLIPMETSQMPIFKGILHGIMTGSAMTTRGNYYTSLTTFLSFQTFNLQLLTLVQSCGDRLFSIICNDAADGELVWRIAALSSLARLVALVNWGIETRACKGNMILDFLTKRNYLGFFIFSIKKQVDADLVRLLEAQEQISVKYAFQLKMSFLLSLAQSSAGAERLVEYGLIQVLTECTFIDKRVENSEHYSDLVLPVFSILLSIYGHLKGSKTLLVNFLKSHESTIQTILKDRNEMTQSSLKQLGLVTALASVTSLYIPLLSQLIKKYSGKWSIEPNNDVDYEKAKTFAPGHTDSLFIDEAKQQVTRILFNCLLVCPGDLLAIRYLQDRINFLTNLYRPLETKVSDGQMTVEEINEICKLGDLSSSQRQHFAVSQLSATCKQVSCELQFAYVLGEVIANPLLTNPDIKPSLKQLLNKLEATEFTDYCLRVLEK